jgi:hypothetical protein
MSRSSQALYALGFQTRGGGFTDSNQGVRGMFLERLASEPHVELLEPLPGDATLEPWMATPPRVYHLAFSVASVADSLDLLADNGYRTVRSPQRAVAFGGRLIAFALHPHVPLVELIER